MLTRNQILRLLAELRWKTVYSSDGDVRLQKPMPGYHDDPELKKIQAELSIQLNSADKIADAIAKLR